ncbi:MAG: hypothetical protein EP326_01370 [Deltaproteobacteria bacterium]|nr:MAG: hypothetical protein EP326_01370 [Deltaproteobacteria bacterium]
MTLFIEAAAVIFQVFVFQVVSIPLMRNLTWYLGLSRNSEWVNEHPEFLKENQRPTENSHYWIGGLITALAMWMVFAQKDYLYLLHVFSALWMLFQYFYFDFRLFKKMEVLIPKPKRSASLSVRRLTDFVPKTLVVLTLLMILLSAGIEIYRFIGADDMTRFWYKKISFFLMTIALLPSFVYSLKRTPICDDMDIDSLYRKLELNVIGMIIFFFSFSNVLTFILIRLGVSEEVLSSGRPLSSFIPLGIYFIFLLYVKRVNERVTERYKLAFQH